MGQSFSILLGTIVFSTFVIGLSESINAVPFYIIVAIVVGLLAYETFDEIRTALRHRERNRRFYSN